MLARTLRIRNNRRRHSNFEYRLRGGRGRRRAGSCTVESHMRNRSVNICASARGATSACRVPQLVAACCACLLCAFIFLLWRRLHNLPQTTLISVIARQEKGEGEEKVKGGGRGEHRPAGSTMRLAVVADTFYAIFKQCHRRGALQAECGGVSPRH